MLMRVKRSGSTPCFPAFFFRLTMCVCLCVCGGEELKFRKGVNSTTLVGTVSNQEGKMWRALLAHKGLRLN